MLHMGKQERIDLFDGDDPPIKVYEAHDVAGDAAGECGNGFFGPRLEWDVPG